MKKVILTPNPYRDRNFQTVRNAEKVLRDCGIDVKICLPFEVDRTYDLPRDLRFSRLDRELRDTDAVICFGGDGTILHMAKTATRNNVPLLGVNIGTMGFMAELESTELEQLSRLANDDYAIDERMMLDVTVQRDRDIIFHDICLNDAVVTKGAVARIVHLAVNCDGIQAMECGGDGVIIATPTGSTAYSLSAGGPIVEPEAHSIVVTPICAHDVASRGFVACDKRVITVGLTQNARRNAYLSVDGGKALRMNPGDIATIKKSALSTRLIRLKNRSFYDVVNMKFKLTEVLANEK
jgi:NAD+ kinase